VQKLSETALELTMIPRARQPLNDRWFFYQNAENLWKWARLDLLGTVLAQAEQGFDSREACMADARRSGYGAQLEEREVGGRRLGRRTRSANVQPQTRRL
jgi:hypothetical protein